MNYKLTAEQMQELGREIVAGMHSEISGWDIEYGREVMNEGLSLPSPEELAAAGLTDIPEYAYKSVEFNRARLTKQADFLANITVNKLLEMQPSPWLNADEVPPTIGNNYSFVIDLPRSPSHGEIFGGKYMGKEWGYHEFIIPGAGYPAKWYCPIPEPPEFLIKKEVIPVDPESE